MKIAIILGTRPEIIKQSPIIRYCAENKLDYFILHTGQHYSYEMDRIFFNELELPEPKYNLNIGSGSHGEQTGKILIAIENILLLESPNIALVQGDTNTVLAGALAASKLGIKIGHVEAGLRSYDRTMPEEINRILTDHLSDFLFCPTENSKEIALKENISPNKIFMTGNTIVDAVQQNLIIAEKKSEILKKLNLQKQNYLLVTAHRQENVDNPENLANILKSLALLSSNLNYPVVYPIHPRTIKMIGQFCLKIPDSVKTIEPTGYLDFLTLLANAKLVLTDSGGIQEEACILKVPCVTLRENTERPETITVGSNILVGTNTETTINGVEKMLNIEKNWDNPFGDGQTATTIMNLLTKTV